MAESCYNQALRAALIKALYGSSDQAKVIEAVKQIITKELTLKSSKEEIVNFCDILMQEATSPMMFDMNDGFTLMYEWSDINDIAVNLILPTLTPKTKSSSGEESKIDNLDPNSESKIIQDSRSTFITSVYGGRSAARAAMEVKFKQILNNFIMFNPHTETEINTQRDLDRSITETLEDLYQEFRKYATDSNLNLKGANALPTSLMIGDVKENWKAIQQIVNTWAFISEFKPSGINALYNKAKAKDANAVSKLGAFQAYFILNNFDRLITAMFPKLIDIAEDTYGQMVSPSMGNRSKYQLDLTNDNVSASWSSDEELSDAVAESSASLKIFWESQLLYNKDTDEALTTMSLQEVAILWNKLRAYKYWCTDPIPAEFLEKLDEGYLTLDEKAVLSYKNALGISVNKSFSDLIYEAESNPKALRLIFKLAAYKSRDPQNHVNINSIRGIHLTREQLNLAYSIYKQVFKENGTIYSAYLKNRTKIDSDYNSQVKDFYNHIVHFFTTTKQIPMSQSKVTDSGNYEVKTLGETALDNSAYGFAGLLDASLSATSEVAGEDSATVRNFKNNVTTKDFKTFTLDRQGIKETKTSDKYIDIVLKEGPLSGKVIRISSNLIASLGTVSDGKFVAEQKFKTLSQDFLTTNEALRNVVFEVLGLRRYANDIDVSNTILVTIRQQGVSDLDLFGLAANVLYNYSISCELLGERLTTTQYETRARSYYQANTHKPRLQKDGTDLKGINDDRTGTLRRLVSALDIVNGVIRDAMVKGADGKMINTITLNQLLATAPDQWHRERLNPNNACNGFNSLYNAYIGEELARDVVAPTGNEKTSDFTPAENFAFNFVADYLSGMYPEKDGESTMRVFPLVISDKTRLPKIKINLEAINPKNGKAWKDHSYEEIQEVAKEELGQYYLNFYNAVKNRFNTLSTRAAINTSDADGTLHLTTGTFGSDIIDNDVRFILGQLNGTIGALDPEKNFAGFNNAIEAFREKERSKFGNYFIKNTPEYQTTKEFAVQIAKANNEDAYTILVDLSTNPASEYRAEFEKYVNKSINDRAENLIQSVLHELTLRAQEAGTPVAITLNSHYILYGGKLWTNFGLVDQLYRWGHFTKEKAESLLPPGLLETGHGEAEAFFEDKAQQFLCDVLQDGGYISLKKGNARIKEGALAKIQNAVLLPATATDSEVKAYSAGKLVLGVISYVGVDSEGGVKTFHEKLTDKATFKKSYILKQTFNYLKYNENPELSSIVANFDSASDWFEDPAFKFKTFIKYLNEALINNELVKRDANALTLERDRRIARVTQESKAYEESLTEKRGALIQTLRQEQASLDPNSRQYRLLDSRITSLQNKLATSLNESRERLQTKIDAINQDFAERIEKSKIYTDSKPILDFGVSLIINPEIRKFNMLSFLFGQEYTIATVGTHLNHPGKDKTNLQSFEAGCWAQQVKRNVTMTATKHAFRVDQLNGLPAKVKQCIITNLKDEVYNLCGTQDLVFNDDGACLTPGVTNYWENASLNEDAVGTDKKTFFHMHDAETGTGYIGKDAGFAATNARIRASKFYKYLNYRALSDGSLDKHFINGGLDITTNYRGGKVIFKDFAYKRILDSDPRLNLEITQLGGKSVDLTKKNLKVIGNSIKFNRANGLTEFTAQVYEDDGTVNTVNLAVRLTNAYSIWQFFGGAYSALINNEGVLYTIDRETKKPEYNTYNDESTRMLAYLGNELGTVKVDKLPLGQNRKPAMNTIHSQLEVDQWLKNSVVMYYPTIESVKQGAANVNDSNLIANLDYKFTSMILELYDAGVQLNAEHHADDTVISMMTQVLNALGARGYTAIEANKAFTALRSLTAINLKGYVDSLGIKDDNARHKFEDFLTTIITKTISSGNALDEGTLAGALLYQAKVLIESGKGLKYEDVKKLIPMDDISLLKAEMSKIASVLVKSCIKLKFPGSMDVLSPSNGKFLLYNGKMESEYGGDLSSLQELDETLAVGKHRNISEVELGKTYRVYNTLNALGENEFIAGTQHGEYTLFKVNTPTDYWLLKTFLVTHPDTLISESTSSGRELASYNIKFKDTEGNLYNIWDIKEVKDLFNQSLQASENRQSLINSLQQTLNALSNDPNFTKVTVIDANNIERTITIDKNNVEISPYELIMSMHDKKQFGLQVGDSVQDITQNRLFFLERQFKDFRENSLGAKDNLYDLELQSINTNDNIYLAFADKPIDTKYWTQVEFTPYQDENGKLWLLNNRNRKVQQIYSEGDKVYKGINGEMLIVSTSPETYIDNTIHSNVTISKRIAKRSSEALLDIFENHLLKCEDAGIQKFLKQFKSRITSKSEAAVEDDAENVSVEQGELAKYIQDYSNEEFTELLSDFIQFGRNSYLNSMKVVQTILSDKVLTVDQKLARLQGADSKGKPIIRNHKVRAMLENALQTHTSFLKSLEVLAARIPAQCMQSFMAMKIAGFDTSGVNTAYVSRFQIYLQGSDFDIDKVSLLGFQFRNGKFVTWSPYMDLSSKALLEASIDLPFPTGTYSRVIEDSDKHCTFGDDVIYGLKDTIIEHVDVVTDSEGNELFRLTAEKEPNPEFDKLDTNFDVLAQYKLYKLSEDTEQSWETKAATIRQINPKDLSDNPIEGQSKFPETEAEVIEYLSKHGESEFIAYCNGISGKARKSNVKGALNDAIAYINAKTDEENARQAATFIIQPGEAWEANSEKILRVLASKIKLGQSVIFKDPSIGKLLSQRGFKVTGNIATKDNSNISAAQDFMQFILNNPDLFTKKGNKWTINFVVKSEQDKIVLLKKLARFINEVNAFNGIPAFTEVVTSEQETYNNSIDELLKVVNKHNLSLNKNKHILQDALLNFISASMYNVSKNPANQIQAQSSVDASDGSVSVIKRIAKPLAYSKKLATYDPGSVSSLYRMMSLTLGGKTNTGIVASSLKVFEVLSQYAFNVLNFGTPEETLALLTNRQIAGTNVQLLANAYQQNKQNFLPIDVMEALQNTDQIVDAYLNFSGFLSLSTDNAKDPTLPKINAGSKMLGLYLAGISVGCDLETLVPILTSKAGLLINDLMNKNIYNGNAGLFDVDAVINYLDNPRNLLAGISTKAKEELIKCYRHYNQENQNENVLDYTLIEFILDPYRGKQILQWLTAARASIYQNNNQTIDDEAVNNAADNAELNDTPNLSNLNNSNSLGRNLKILIDRIEDFLNLKNDITKCYITLNGEKVNAYKQIVELNKMHSEMRCFSPIGQLNQDLPNSIDEQIVWKRKFEKGIKTRLDHLSPSEANSAKVKNAKARLKALNSTVLEIEDSKLDYTVDFIKFVEDENYRNEIISTYDDLKYAVNIYGAMASLPNYFGYMQTLASQYRLNSASSNIYKAVDYLTRYFIPIKGSEDEKQRKVNKLIDWLNDDITSSFMLEFLEPITVKAQENEELPVYYKPVQDGSLERSKGAKGESLKIVLGTAEGNNTFKCIMEEKVLPELQSGLYKDNPLIQALVFVKNTQTSDGNPIKKIALQTSGIPNTEYENNKLSEYKYGLEQLADMRIGCLGMTLVDALFAYNLIVNKGKSTQSSLSNLFEGWSQSQGKSAEEYTYSSAFIEAYYNYRKIKSEQLLETYTRPSKAIIKKIQKALAPYDGQFSSNEQYIYVKNPVTRKRELLEKQEKPKNSNSDFDENNEDFTDIDSENENSLAGMDNEDFDDEGNSADQKQQEHQNRIVNHGYKLVGVGGNLRIVESFLATKSEKQSQILQVNPITNDISVVNPKSGKLITFGEVKKTMSKNAQQSLKATNMKELLVEAGMMKETGEPVQSADTILSYLESLKNESSTCK